MIDFEYKPKYNIQDFRKIIELLRSPEGCPWDMEQTHESIRRNMLEEAYEVCEAIDENDTEHLREELGDLLMQVLFHSRIEEEKGVFDFDSVADAAVKKLIFRHPHVFGEVTVTGSTEVLKNWDELKRKERSQNTFTEEMKAVAGTLPSLWRAEKIQNKAKKVGFDWTDVSGALAKLTEELSELKLAVEINDKQNIEEELGDLLFAAVNVARFVKLDPEQSLNASSDKFILRFSYMEQKAAELSKKLSEMSHEELEVLYDEAKSMQ